MLQGRAWVVNYSVLNLASQAMHDVVHDFLSSQISHSLELDKFPIETRCDSTDRQRGGHCRHSPWLWGVGWRARSV